MPERLQYQYQCVTMTASAIISATSAIICDDCKTPSAIDFKSNQVPLSLFKFNSGFKPGASSCHWHNLPVTRKLEALRLLKLCTNITAITMSRGITKLPHPTLYSLSVVNPPMCLYVHSNTFP